MVMGDNEAAFVLSILTWVSPELAFSKIKRVKRPCYRKGVTKDMVTMRKDGYTFREIGQYFGLTESAVYNRINKNWGK